MTRETVQNSDPQLHAVPASSHNTAGERQGLRPGGSHGGSEPRRGVRVPHGTYCSGAR